MTALFERLYDELHAPLRNHIRLTVGDMETAEDICQEVWAKLADRVDDYAARPDFNGKALVFRAARNKALDHLRRGQSVAAGGRVTFSPIEAAGHAAAPDPEPEAAALAAERDPDAAAMLAAAYLGLPLREARALWMCEVERRPYEDIAALMRGTVPAVKSVLYRARERQRLLAGMEAKARARGNGLADRFWRSVDAGDRAAAAGCWRWLGRVHPTGGFPLFQVRCAAGRSMHSRPARRVGWVLLRGPLAPGVRLHAACGHQWCVNPAHQQLVAATGWGHARSGAHYRPLRVDPAHAPPPPTGAELRARRVALGLSQKDMAAVFGCSQSGISHAETSTQIIAYDRLVEMAAVLDRLERERAEGRAA